MPEKSKANKIYQPHPKTELCLALNLARHRFVEILKHILNDEKITEDNWKSRVKEFSESDRTKKPNKEQEILIDKISKYLPFVRPENDKLLEIRMIKKIGGLLNGQRNYYSHDKHKSIKIIFNKEKANDSEIKNICDLFAVATESLIANDKNTYTNDDFTHLKLIDDRKDETAPPYLSSFIAKSKPEETEYALFYKSTDGYELSERGAMFLASLFLDKKEANEFLSGMTGFKKTDGNKFKATRDVFTYYSGKIFYERENTKNADVSLFFNMVSYLEKKPECLPAVEVEESRVKDLFGHFAIRYLLMDKDDIKIRQFTGYKRVKKEREAITRKGIVIPVTETEDEKIYSEYLQQKIALTGNNLYFEYNGEKGEMGFKALSQLVFAKLHRSEKGYESIFDDVKKKMHQYLFEYNTILKQIKSGTINSIESLQEKLTGKTVKLEEIPNAIQTAFGKGKEDNEEFIKRVLKRLNNRIAEIEEKLAALKSTEAQPRIYDMVTFMLHDYMDSLPKDKKPGSGLYERLHYDFTFFGRFKGKLKNTLENKYSDFNSSILAKALEKNDLHDVYSDYLSRLKKQIENNKSKLENETAPNKKLHYAKECSVRLGISQKEFESKSTKPHERTSSPKDIAEMLLSKPIPIPNNLISKAILERINLTVNGKQVNRLGTLIDIYLPGKGFDSSRSDSEKNRMTGEYYLDIDNQYKGVQLKKIRLSRTQDKLIRLIIGEYAKGFIKKSVTLELPDEKPVKELYRSEVIMDFFDRKIKFPFDKYNKVKKLLYDKRIEVITKHHLESNIKQIEFTDQTDKKFVIDEEKEKYKKSQKRLISESLEFEKRFWTKNDFETLLTKYTEYPTHISHRNILAEAKADNTLGNFRNNALHNDVPKTRGYFKSAFENYGNLLK